MWLGQAFVAQSPYGWGAGYSVFSWISLAADLMIGVLLILWAILPILLMTFGFDCVRNARPTEWRWRGAWVGAVTASMVLEALTVPLSYRFPAATPDWDALAVSLGFVAIGAVMTVMLFSAARSKAADHPGPYDLPGSAPA